MKTCTRCIMNDSSDPTIRFDAEGRCNYCTDALARKSTVYFPNEEGSKRLDELLERVRYDGRGRDYDCIMGLSGGLDSSYLLYLGNKWNLRILAVHIDDGFDTEISKRNLKKLVEKTSVDYKVIKPDSVQYNALTKAYLKAGVANIAVPQDNILFAYIYDMVRRYRLKHFLSGGNFALECILQQGNTHNSYDVANLKDINRRFGEQPINKLKFISMTRRELDSRIFGLQSERPLDYVDYNRDRAFQELKDFCGFEYYGRKHLENILTAFAQLYWFPKKFGVDKRTSHLSSMIVSGQLTREDALRQMEEPLYDEEMMREYISIIKRELAITDDEFETIMQAPVHAHAEYKTEITYRLIRGLYRFIRGAGFKR